MYINHTDYKALGYTVVPEAQFPRFQARAEQAIRRYTQNRIVEMTDAMNKRGVCELMDLFWLGDNPNSEEAKARQVVTSFTNQKYRETYLGSDRGDMKAAAPAQLTEADVLNIYFTRDQVWRGVGPTQPAVIISPIEGGETP